MPLLKPCDTRYSKRYGLHCETAERVNLTASVFRVIDDILDGNTERRIIVLDLERRIPALWTEISICPAAFQAFQAIAYVAAFVSDSQAFAEMVHRVMDVVKVKLIADEKGRSLTREEDMTTLEKETAFRT